MSVPVELEWWAEYPLVDHLEHEREESHRHRMRLLFHAFRKIQRWVVQPSKHRDATRSNTISWDSLHRWNDFYKPGSLKG